MNLLIPHALEATLVLVADGADGVVPVAGDTN